MTPDQKKTLLRRFAKLYPEPQSELTFKNNYQLVCAVMLSAQCTDKKVNEVTPHLFRACANYKQLAAAEVGEIEIIIRPVNYYKTKAKHLVAMARLVTTEHRGRLPVSFEALISLPGVGRKTANVIQCELNIEPALPVDTHVFRVSKRLGVADGKNPDQVEASLKQAFPPETWHHLHHWLIFHGRRVCKAQRPLCAGCTLSDLCPSSQV